MREKPSSSVYSLEGGWTGYEGHVVHMVHDVGKFTKNKPRKINDLSFLLVRYERVDDTH